MVKHLIALTTSWLIAWISLNAFHTSDDHRLVRASLSVDLEEKDLSDVNAAVISPNSDEVTDSEDIYFFKLYPITSSKDETENIIKALERYLSIEIFECMFENIFELIIKQSNWLNFTLSLEYLKKYIGILMLLGYHKLP